MFPSRWCCRQLFVIPALLAPLWSGRHYCAEGLWGAGLRTRSAVTWFPVVRGSGCISAAATGPGCNQEGSVRKPVLLVPPCPPLGHPDDHVSWDCGPGPCVLRPLRLPIRAPWGVPLCRSQAATVLSRGTFVGLLVVEGGIRNGFSLP